MGTKAQSTFPDILRAAADGDVETLKLMLDRVSANTTNSIGQGTLHLAAMWGHLDAVRVLINARANVNMSNEFGVTPLHYAAEHSRYSVAALLIEHGANKKSVARNGFVPWECAKAGADDLRALLGAPTLEVHKAVKHSDLPLLTKLVSDGADLSETDTDGQTAMHLAIVADLPKCGDEACADTDCTLEHGGKKAGAIEMLQALLAAGTVASTAADLARGLCTRAEVAEGRSYTPFHLAARLGTSKMMEMLLGAAPVEEETGEIVRVVLEMRTHLSGEYYGSSNWGKKDADGELEELDNEDMTMLHLALERLEPDEDEDSDDDEEMVDVSEAPDGLTDKQRDEAAARAEATKIATMLIEKGADVNAPDSKGRTAIHQAVAVGEHAIARKLLDSKADPTIGCKAIGMANNVLHQATQKGDGAMIKLLMDAKAAAGGDAPVAKLDVNATGQNGFTPLALAARSGCEAAAKALLEGGADPKIVIVGGKSALDLARLNKKAAIVKLFGAEM